MKEVVISLKELSISIDESNFILFFVKPLFILFIYFGIYSRTTGFFGFSGGQLTVLMTFSLFCLAVFHIIFFKREIRVSNFAYFICLFFVISGALPFFAIFLYGAEPRAIVRYSFEIGINLFMFFSIYYFIREKIITPKFFIYSIAFVGLFAALNYLSVLFTQVSIYRIYRLSGLNTMGTAFSIAVFAWMLIVFIHAQRENQSTLKKWIGYGCLVLIFLSMLFTGTRSAIIALAVALFLFQILGMKSKKFTRYVLYGSLGMAAVIFIVALNFDLSNLWGRFSWTSITRMAGMRFTLYAKSITDLTFLDFFFGRPDFYIFSNEADDFINPHNLFLGTIRYNGILLFIMLIFIFLILFYKYSALYKIHKNQSEYRVIESSILIFFVMIVIYTMFSGGRTTRSFSFFITLGYAVGYLELFKNLRSYEEYKSLII